MYCWMSLSVVPSPLIVNLGVLQIVQITLHARDLAWLVRSDVAHVCFVLMASSWSSTMHCLIVSSGVCNVGVTLFWPPGWRVFCKALGDVEDPKEQPSSDPGEELPAPETDSFWLSSSSESSVGGGGFLFCAAFLGAPLL